MDDEHHTRQPKQGTDLPHGRKIHTNGIGIVAALSKEKTQGSFHKEMFWGAHSYLPVRQCDFAIKAESSCRYGKIGLATTVTRRRIDSNLRCNTITRYRFHGFNLFLVSLHTYLSAGQGSPDVDLDLDVVEVTTGTIHVCLSDAAQPTTISRRTIRRTTKNVLLNGL